MATIRIRITTFTVRPPRAPARVGQQWNGLIDQCFNRASSILGRHGITLQREHRVDHGVEFSRQALTQDHYHHGRDIGRSPQRMFRDQDAEGEDAYRRSVAAGTAREHLRDSEYWVRVANCVAYSSTPGTLAREALGILALNNSPGEVSTYWVPGIASPEGAAADTACSPMYSNVGVVEGDLPGPDFQRRHARPRTGAHPDEDGPLRRTRRPSARLPMRAPSQPDAFPRVRRTGHGAHGPTAGPLEAGGGIQPLRLAHARGIRGGHEGLRQLEVELEPDAAGKDVPVKLKIADRPFLMVFLIEARNLDCPRCIRENEPIPDCYRLIFKQL